MAVWFFNFKYFVHMEFGVVVADQSAAFTMRVCPLLSVLGLEFDLSVGVGVCVCMRVCFRAALHSIAMCKASHLQQ